LHPVHKIVADAVDNGTPLTVKDLRELRARSEKAITGVKGFFWGGVIILNLVLWVPLPFDKTLMIGVAAAIMALAFIIPILGLRKHQKMLALLEASLVAPKPKNASEAGKLYIEKVRKEGRSFVVAEYEVLEGSKTGEIVS